MEINSTCHKQKIKVKEKRKIKNKDLHCAVYSPIWAHLTLAQFKILSSLQKMWKLRSQKVW